MKRYLKYLIRYFYIKYINEVYIPSGTKLKIKTEYKSAQLVCPKTRRETSFSFLGHNIFFD